MPERDQITRLREARTIEKCSLAHTVACIDIPQGVPPIDDSAQISPTRGSLLDPPKPRACFCRIQRVPLVREASEILDVVLTPRERPSRVQEAERRAFVFQREPIGRRENTPMKSEGAIVIGKREEQALGFTQRLTCCRWIAQLPSLEAGKVPIDPSVPLPARRCERALC